MTAEKEPIQPIDPMAFALAFVGGPVLASLAVAAPGVLAIFAEGFFLFPVVAGAALVIGGPAYVALGLPVLLIGAHYRPLTVDHVIGWSLYACVALIVLSVLSSLAEPDLIGLISLPLIGTVFAPLWGWSFANLYRRLARPV